MRFINLEVFKIARAFKPQNDIAARAMTFVCGAYTAACNNYVTTASLWQQQRNCSRSPHLSCDNPYPVPMPTLGRHDTTFFMISWSLKLNITDAVCK